MMSCPACENKGRAAETSINTTTRWSLHFIGLQIRYCWSALRPHAPGTPWRGIFPGGDYADTQLHNRTLPQAAAYEAGLQPGQPALQSFSRLPVCLWESPVQGRHFPDVLIRSGSSSRSARLWQVRLRVQLFFLTGCR